MNPLIDFLESGLDGASLRHKAISNNIANVDTPGYKREDVDFLSTLKAESSRLENNFENKLSLSTTDDAHIKTATASTGIASTGTKTPFKLVHMNNTSSRDDGNNIDVEYEMAEMAKNNIYYNTLIQQVTDRFKFINDAISKGGS